MTMVFVVGSASWRASRASHCGNDSFRPPERRRSSDGKIGLLAKVRSVDLTGAVLLLGAATMLFYALQRAADGTDWSSSLVAGLLVGAGVTPLVFAAWQGYQDEKALVIPPMLKQRTVHTAEVAMYAAMIAYIYFFPVHFQAIDGASIICSPVDLLPLVVTCSVFSIISGILVTVIGYFMPPVVLGLALTMIAAGLMIAISEATSTANWAGYQILLGAGLGLALHSGLFGIQAVSPPDDNPMGTSLMTFYQCLREALNVSIGNAVLLNILRDHRKALTSEGVEINSVIAAGATTFRCLVHASGLEALLSAYNHALV